MGLIQEYATLKLAKGKGVTTTTTPAIIDVKSPGDPTNPKGGRVVRGGQAWFENPHVGDYIEVYLVDIDGIIPVASRVAFSSYPIIGSFTDDDVDAINKGFWIPIHSKYVEVRAIGDMGFINSGFYLRMIGHKGDNSVDTFRTNIEWGKR